MKRVAVIAQTADPARGSEFATGWGAVRDLYLDPRIRFAFQIDVFISANGNNRENILREISELDPRPNFIFVPQVLPQMHRLMGRVLRLVWQAVIWRRIARGGYDIVHQVSPNSIGYLNPIFFTNQRLRRIVGPMRIEPRASISGIYIKSWAVMLRHLTIRVKEIAEAVLFLAQRRAVAYQADLHLSPLASDAKNDNQIYCRETAFVEVAPPAAARRDERGWTVIWSGFGDIHRKNEHLAAQIVAAAIQDPRLSEVNFIFYGGRGRRLSSPRVDYSDGLPRGEFLAHLSDRTIYLLTSLLELNSVLAEEVLLRNGHVVVGPLPSFLGRHDNPRVHRVDRYSDSKAWTDALAAAIVTQTGAAPARAPEVDHVVRRILALAETT